MADNEPQQTLMVNDDVILPENISETKRSTDLPLKEFEATTTTDILQRAFEESGEYDTSLLNRTNNHIPELMKNPIQHLSDHSYIHSANSNASSSIESQDPNSLCKGDISLLNASNFELSKVINANSSEIIISDNTNLNNNDKLKITENSNILSSNKTEAFSNTSNNDSLLQTQILNNQDTTKQSLPSNFVSLSSTNVTNIKLFTKQTNAPLGSMENPIQIIHNGNTYHSAQVLTQVQLQQIAHVLQQQQAKKLINGSKSITFEPNTRTRIVCRVVHPSELQQDNVQRLNTESATVFRARGRSKKFISRKSEDEDKGNALSKEEREEKKKHRPRTRSGRISKPPSYMVKDYKRIHHLDFNDDAVDDSDGGYSDYHVSDDENRRGNKSGNLPPGVTTAKQRNYSCATCSKAYIGQGGLSRHYRLNPSHGKMPEGDDVSTQDENSNSSFASSVLSNSMCNTSNPGSVPYNPNRTEIETILTVQQTPSNQDTLVLDKRKTKLTEILKSFSTVELVDALLPKLVQEVPLWTFFAAKCHKQSESLCIFEMLKEFEKFLIQMQRVSLTCLSPASEVDQGKTIINISSKQIADALMLEKGSYAVKETEIVSANLKLMESSLQNVNCVADTDSNLTNGVLYPYPKRKRLDNVEINVNTDLPELILSNGHNEVESSISEESLLENTSIPQQQVQLLSANVGKEETCNEIMQKNLFDLSSTTIVTPSSLSSGCLSAINTTDLQKSNSLTAPNDIQNFQNLLLKKARLLGSSQNQISWRTISSLPANDFPISSNCNSNESAPQAQIKEGSDAQNQVGSCSVIGNKAFQALNFDPVAAIFNSCSEYSQAHQSSASITPSASFINPVCISSNSLTTQVAIQSEPTENLPSCLVVANAKDSNSSIENKEMQSCGLTTSQSESQNEVKTTESQVLRQLMLSNGQLINLWPSEENSEKSTVEQIFQGYVPGNLIILQNPDRSLQVPENQDEALETLQILTTADSTTPEQAESHTYTTVNM